MPGLIFLLAAMLSLGGGQAPPSDPVDTVRQLYAAADYEAALAEADRLAGDSVESQGVDLERYRALCNLALGRMDRAESAIEQVFRSDPAYEPGEQEPPRVRAAFATVRARVLPDIVRGTYAEAKADYDRKQYADAIAGFERALGILDSLESADPSLGDLRTLTTGFLDLSRAAATPPPAPPIEPAPPAAVSDAAVSPAPAAAAPPEPSAATPTLTKGPEVLRQVVPGWNPLWFRTEVKREFRGAVEISIDENGGVAAARIVQSINPVYDRQLLDAAAKWLYVPAERNGTPVASTKVVEIILRPPDE